MRNKWLVGTGIAVLSVLFSVSVAYAALTFSATAVTSDGALTLTTGAAATAVTVTYGISANAATTTDSLYVGGLAQLTGATASGTALVIGNDVPLFRNAANQLRLQGTLSVSAGVTANAATTTDSLSVGGLTTLTGATASGTALVVGTDVPLFRNAANQLRLQGTLSVSAGVTANAATTTDSLSVGGRALLNSFTSVGTTTATTTRQLFVGAVKGTATTTLMISGAKGSDSCIEMYRNGAAFSLFITPSSSPSYANWVVAVKPGSCRDQN